MRCALLLLCIGCTPLEPPDVAPGPWPPKPGTTWQIQLRGTIDTSHEVEVYVLDLFDAPQPTIDELHARGAKVICYFSAGSFEDWRYDASLYPRTAIGMPLDGWPGEYWIDTRDAGVRSVLASRFDYAMSRGCDGVDPDNVDGYTQQSGFPLTAGHQLDFNKFLSQEARKRGLLVGLKNDPDQVAELVDFFDWQINEQCFEYGECDKLAPFVAAGKPVWGLEYAAASQAGPICDDANARNFDTLIMSLELDGSRFACR